LDFPNSLAGFRVGDFLEDKDFDSLVQDGPKEEGSQDWKSREDYPYLCVGTHHLMITCITVRDECWMAGTNLIGKTIQEVTACIGSAVRSTEELGDYLCHTLFNGLEIWECDGEVILIQWADWDLIPY
jgi:hypothetical protein